MKKIHETEEKVTKPYGDHEGSPDIAIMSCR